MESTMNIINIKFTHPCAQPPKYTFGEQVAMRSNCKPQKWATGTITGLRLDDYSANTWNYTVVFDYPQGFCEEFIENDLVTKNQLACLSMS
jgi:hypothetical protein